MLCKLNLSLLRCFVRKTAGNAGLSNAVAAATAGKISGNADTDAGVVDQIYTQQHLELRDALHKVLYHLLYQYMLLTVLDISTFMFIHDKETNSRKHSLFQLIEKEINPHVDEWEKQHSFPAHTVFKKLGQAGFLGVNKPVGN